MPVFAEELSDEAPSVLTDAVKEEVIQNGEWRANEDGSYSFILTKTDVPFSRSSASSHTSINYTLIPITEEAEENLDRIFQEARSGGSKKLTNSDEAGCVSAYSIINWNDKKENAREYVYLTSVSGGYSAEGSGSYISSGVSVSAQSLRVGQTGFTAEGYKTQYKDFTISTSSRSYSYSSSNWSGFLPVESTSEKSIMGSYYVITLKRGTSTWNCEISNNY
ncbi:MAG: hypothetical protein K2N34_14210 [Lachnospiraceae bacterium]|nr:hypothetical protein [Lachnospiraceae bacterium]